MTDDNNNDDNDGQNQLLNPARAYAVRGNEFVITRSTQFGLASFLGQKLPPLVHSLWEMSMVCNSGTQQAIVIKLEISSKYLIQYILGENLGNPTLPIN